MAKTESNSKPKKLLKELTVGYRGPAASTHIRQFVNINRPRFYRTLYVPQMLKDPRVSFGVKLIRGPILSKARFVVDTDNEEVRKYLIRQIVRFWTKGAPISLRCIEDGYSGSEIIYRFNNAHGIFDFYRLKHLHSTNLRPYIDRKTDTITHMRVKNIKKKGVVFVPRPKFFWAVHDQGHDRWFGRSRLEKAFIPWWENWMPRGYRATRQMWFYKNAYAGCVVRFPQGATENDQGIKVPNQLLAQEMADRYQTGSSVVLPKSPDGDNDWELEPGKGIAVPDGLLEYGEIIGDEIWEGLGVPPEVVASDESGSFAGRRVPQQAFYSLLQEIINEHIIDADEQIFRPLVNLNFGPVDYEINTISLLDTLQEEEMGLITGKLGGEEEGEGEPNDGKIEDRKRNSENRREEQISKNQS